MNKETQIVLALGAVAIAAYFVYNQSSALSNGIDNVTSGAGKAVEVVGVTAGLGALIYYWPVLFL